jgi:hypothetical protein
MIESVNVEAADGAGAGAVICRVTTGPPIMCWSTIELAPLEGAMQL